MSRLFAVLAFLTVGCSISEAQTHIHVPFGSAAVSRSEIAFVLNVDLQTVEAENLTQSSGVAEHSPRWSPDGRR